MQHHGRARAVAVSLAGLAVLAAPARTAGVLLGGWEGDGLAQGYGYAAAGQRWPGQSSFGAAVRFQASYLYYRFDEANGVTWVRSPGVTLLAGPSATGSRGSSTLFVGLDARNERRERPAGNSRDTRTGVQLQWEASPALEPRLRAFVLGQYSFANDYTYARGAVGRQITNLAWDRPVTTVLGAETAGQGNQESNAWQVGGYAEWTLARAALSLSVHAGYKSSGARGAARQGTYYAGLGAYISR